MRYALFKLFFICFTWNIHENCSWRTKRRCDYIFALHKITIDLFHLYEPISAQLQTCRRQWITLLQLRCNTMHPSEWINCEIMINKSNSTWANGVYFQWVFRFSLDGMHLIKCLCQGMKWNEDVIQLYTTN